MRRAVAFAAALAAALGVAGCLDLGLVSEVAFAPAVPGLPADQPWVAFPVGAWVTEGGIRADAMAACLSPACATPAAVGLFTAAGPEGDVIAGLVADPARLARVLSAPRKPDPRVARAPSVSGKPVRAPTPPPPVEVAVQRLATAEGSGFVVRMTRQDGGHPAFGVVLARPRGGSTAFVLVVSGSEDVARRLAREVTAKIG